MKSYFTLLKSASLFLFAVAMPLIGQVHTVVIDAFIQDPLVPIPGFGIAAGDGRGFGQSGSSRFTQTVLVDSVTQNVTVGSPSGDPSILYSGSTAYNTPGNYSSANVAVSHPNSNTTVITFTGNHVNPNVSLAPGITYSFTITYTKSTDSFTISSYSADKFPSWEIFINGVSRLQLQEVSPMHLFPLFPNYTSPITTTPIPYVMPAGYYINHTNFMSARPNGDVLLFNPNLVPIDSSNGVQVGTATVVQYQDDNGDWHDWTE